MRKILLAIAASFVLAAVVAPLTARAGENVNCDKVPKAEWAQCIFDQAAAQSSE